MGQIGFHQSAANHHLQQHWPALGVPGNSRVFVPLCGKSLDLLWLRDRGHPVAAVELSPVALESFIVEHGVLANRHAIQGFDIYEARELQLFRGDFFDLTAEQLGPVSAVYDRAALISWAPELREPYVEHLAALTTPGTHTLLIVMEYPQAQMSGPPFSLSAGDIARLYERHHSIQELSRQNILASEPRLKTRGLTELHEVCYRLTRL